MYPTTFVSCFGILLQSCVRLNPNILNPNILNRNIFAILNFHLAIYRILFFLFTIYFWNFLPVSVATAESFGNLKVRLYEYLFLNEV